MGTKKLVSYGSSDTISTLYSKTAKKFKGKSVRRDLVLYLSSFHGDEPLLRCDNAYL